MPSFICPCYHAARSMSASNGPLPIPTSFPVQWPDPAMESLYWTWDQVHFPHPVTPLTSSIETPSFTEGASRGFQAISIPLTFRHFVANGYVYLCMEFLEETTEFPPPWWPRVEAEFLRRLPVLTQTWEQEYLPEVQAANRRLLDFDYAGAGTPELLAFIDETRRLRARMWDLHMQAVIPVIGAASRFAEVYEQLLGKPSGNEPYLLLQGFENKTVESGKALWNLSRRALAAPAVAKLIGETPLEELPDALHGSAEGRAFWRDFQCYLEEYGWRSDAFDLSDPAWAEDPAIPLAALRDFLEAPDEADPALKEELCREERERLVQETQARLDGHEAKPIFQMMLGAAQQYLPIQENHNFYIDQMNTVLTRRPLLELGRRLAAAGAVADHDDVFYLTYEELRPAIARPKSRDWPALVDERRRARAGPPSCRRANWARPLPRACATTRSRLRSLASGRSPHKTRR